MGFELFRWKGENKPEIICDKCRKPILKVSSGIIVWNPEKMEEGKSIEFKTFHKGKCDDRKLGFSMELRGYFEYLNWNCMRDDKVD